MEGTTVDLDRVRDEVAKRFAGVVDTQLDKLEALIARQVKERCQVTPPEERLLRLELRVVLRELVTAIAVTLTEYEIADLWGQEGDEAGDTGEPR